MDIVEVRRAIKRVIRYHADALRQIGTSQPKLLELAAVTGIAEHYKSHGYTVKVVNPKGKRAFSVKTSTRGYPWNFSRLGITKGTETVELHMNVLIRSAHDDGIYCVDVGVVESGSIPSTKPVGPWVCLDNSYLLTFAEVKKLVVYPMLLAQFVGIVHEIMPTFLQPSSTSAHPSHLPPILIALGHFSGNSSTIVRNYPVRGIRVTIAENYDMRLARVRGGAVGSPF